MKAACEACRRTTRDSLYVREATGPRNVSACTLRPLTAGKRPAPPGTPDTLWQRLRVEKNGQKLDLTRLSRTSLFALASTSTHNVHFDDPRWRPGRSRWSSTRW
jgi:hypothetical protein